MSARAPDPERAARVRVARAWAGLSQGDLGERLGEGYGEQTVRRMETGQRDISTNELVTIAETCGVPEDFMRNGWRTRDERLDQLTKSLEALTAEIRNPRRKRSGDRPRTPA